MCRFKTIEFYGEYLIYKYLCVAHDFAAVFQTKNNRTLIRIDTEHNIDMNRYIYIYIYVYIEANIDTTRYENKTKTSYIRIDTGTKKHNVYIYIRINMRSQT